MSALFNTLSIKLTGEIRDDVVTLDNITLVASRIGRTLPHSLAELLVAANGLTFAPPAQFRGSEILGILSLWQIERTIQTLGEFIPAFLLPFAHSLATYYCVDSSAMVYEVTGVGDQTPRIVIDPLFLPLKMFVEELEPGTSPGGRVSLT